MFQLMNEARTDVAMQGSPVASTAYMHAVTYAKNRKQGRARHPDDESRGRRSPSSSTRT
jgi:alkylation response protein AidB-like acyl-CoA dehydrogenase